MSGQEQASSLTAGGPATGNYDALSNLLDSVRRQWSLADDPASRLDLERRVHETMTGHAKESLSPAEARRLARLVDLVRRQWVIAANPASRAGFERRVEGAIYGRINEIMREGREDKDVIKRLEHLLDQQQAEHRHTLVRVRALLRRGRRTVSMDALRAALSTCEFCSLHDAVTCWRQRPVCQSCFDHITADGAEPA